MAPPAAAQDTGGTVVPTRTVAEPDGVNSLLHNSAGLATLRSWELRVYNTQLTETSGEGTAVLFGMHVFGPLSVGAGVEHLRPNGLDSRFRLTLGVGLKLHEVFRLGLAFRSISADTFNDADAIDIGFLIRPASWVSIGLHVRDLNTPTLGGVVHPRVYGVGLGFRPGTDRVTLEAGAEVREDNGDVDAIGRLRFEPIEGLEIAGRVAVQPRGDDIFLDVGMSLAVHFGQGGVEGGVILRNGPGAETFSGYTVGARLSGASYPKIYEQGDRTVTVELAGTGETPRPGLFSEGSAFARSAVYLDALQRDDSVSGIIIRDRGAGFGWAQAEEIRDLIAGLRAAGKDVTVFFEEGDLRHLFAYAGANRRIVDPAGGLRLIGLGTTLTYYKNILDKLHVDTQWVYFGKYKSAPEAFYRTGPSDAADEARNSLLDTLYGQLTRSIGADLGLSQDKVESLIDNGPYVAAECKTEGLVDAVAFWDEVEETIETARGHGIRIGRPAIADRDAREPWARPPVIAVIPVEGSIVSGKSNVVPIIGGRNVGDRTIVSALDAAVRDPDTVGILVRVNSPGGSAGASDHMYRALKKAAERKPVVVSFGNVAASGGYYLAMGGKEIFAADATVTGSIGIFTGKPIFRRLFDLIGLGRKTYTRGKRADLFSFDRKWTPEEMAVVKQKVKVFYDLFLERVSEGRDIPVDQVQDVAQGRVWMGSQARDRKLVDQRGGVAMAVRRLKERAGLDLSDPVRLRFLPEAGIVDRVRSTLGVELAALADQVGDLRDALLVAYPFLNGFSAGEPLALMPAIITFDP